jgi:alkanesulfonate monooxygenase SsuD/methylene tetrahydromethanopterin reductase-like flavin-dependent oxidoreductase (luciferase family)
VIERKLERLREVEAGLQPEPQQVHGRVLADRFSHYGGTLPNPAVFGAAIAARMPAADLQERLDIYRQAAHEAGHDHRLLKDHGQAPRAGRRFGEAASELARPAYDNYQRMAGARSQHGPQAYWRAGADWDKHRAECRVIGGTPADCIEQIDYWRRTLDLTHIGGTFHFGGLDQQATLRSLELFAREVAPRFTAPDL